MKKVVGKRKRRLKESNYMTDIYQKEVTKNKDLIAKKRERKNLNKNLTKKQKKLIMRISTYNIYLE